jgi:glyoxylase-like metal-dependent hydrolase (beta-lactamase superfamily II)
MKRILCILALASPATPLATQAQQPSTYKVYAIRFAETARPAPVSVFVDKGPDNDSVNMVFSIWLIRGGNGKNVLLDAGFQNNPEATKEFGLVNYIRPDSALAGLGLKAADITDIILSHPHFDHINGVGLFPNAHVWIQKEDYNYFVGAMWANDSMTDVYDKQDVRTIVELNMAHKVTLVDGDNKEIYPGIKVYTGSRHTYNSQYVVVNTGTKNIVLASDNIWVYYSLDHMMPAAHGGTLDPAGYVRAMARMKTLATSPKYIIPGHDAKVYMMFPDVTARIVEIK